MSVFAYRGNPNLISAIEGRLSESGFMREGEIELAEYVITFCTSTSELEDLYFGDDGLVEHLNRGSVVVDLSATTPNFANEMNAVITISDVVFIEAPMVVRNQVSQSPFERSNLTCFAAGEDDTVDRARKLLDAIFGDVQIVGSPGIAQLARASNTLQKVAEVVSAIEANALFLGISRGISTLEVKDFEPEATSPEAYFILQAIREKRFDGSFTVGMLMNELSAAIMAADDSEIILPQAEAAFHLLELLAIVGGAQKSPAALALVYGNAKEDLWREQGLDWARAQTLYNDDSHFEDDFGDSADEMDDIYDDEDGFSEDIFPGFTYSNN